MSNNRRARQLFPVLALLAFAAFLMFSTFFAKPEPGGAAEVQSISGIADSISVDDLIAMVFWEKSGSDHLWNDILEEKRKGLRDQVGQKMYNLL
jgi:hypothetical protein